MSDDPGTVRDLKTGAFIGKTDDLTRTFVESALSARDRKGQVFIVLGENDQTEPPELAAALEEAGIDYVRDDRVNGSAMLLEGDAVTWDPDARADLVVNEGSTGIIRG